MTHKNFLGILLLFLSGCYMYPEVYVNCKPPKVFCQNLRVCCDAGCSCGQRACIQPGYKEIIDGAVFAICRNEQYSCTYEYSLPEKTAVTEIACIPVNQACFTHRTGKSIQICYCPPPSRQISYDSSRCSENQTAVCIKEIYY